MRFFKYISKGLWFTLAASFLSACSIVNLRYLMVVGENPLNVTVWIGIFALLPWLFLFKKHSLEFRKLPRRMILLVFFVGIAGSIGVNYLQTFALAHTTAVNFAFLYRTVIVFTILFAWLFFKEKITREKGILVGFILLGSYFLTTNGQGVALTTGDLYAILMAASAALIGNILTKHTVAKMHPELSGSITTVVGTLCLVVLATVTGVFSVPNHLSFILLGSVLWFGLIIFRNRAFQITTASFVTMIFATNALFVAILSFFLLHETLTPIEMFGGLIIVGSAFLVEKFKI